jgi:hypothetical protein
LRPASFFFSHFDSVCLSPFVVNMAALSQDSLQTLIIMWVFTWVAMAIMVLRLALRKVRRQAFDISDYLTMVAMFCLLMRNGAIHVVLVWGTNNMSAALRAGKFSEEEIYQRTVGSKLTLVNRVFYNT